MRIFHLINLLEPTSAKRYNCVPANGRVYRRHSVHPPYYLEGHDRDVVQDRTYARVRDDARKLSSYDIYIFGIRLDELHSRARYLDVAGLRNSPHSQ